MAVFLPRLIRSFGYFKGIIAKTGIIFIIATYISSVYVGTLPVFEVDPGYIGHPFELPFSILNRSDIFDINDLEIVCYVNPSNVDGFIANKPVQNAFIFAGRIRFIRPHEKLNTTCGLNGPPLDNVALITEDQTKWVGSNIWVIACYYTKYLGFWGRKSISQRFRLIKSDLGYRWIEGQGGQDQTYIEAYTIPIRGGILMGFPLGPNPRCHEK